MSVSETLRMVLNRPSAASERYDLERGMRGEVKIMITGVRSEDETLADLRARIDAEFESACARYPMTSGYVRANGGE